MYEIRREDEDSVLEDTDVVAVLEAMLGVSNQDFSELLKAIKPEPRGNITYGRGGGGGLHLQQHIGVTSFVKKTIHLFSQGVP